MLVIRTMACKPEEFSLLDLLEMGILALEGLLKVLNLQNNHTLQCKELSKWYRDDYSDASKFDSRYI